jgi:hypothetical protein
MKGSPVPEAAEVRAPQARRALRPVVRAMVPIGVAAGLSVAGISLWAAADPAHDPACSRPASAATSSDPFEVLRVAWSKVTGKRYVSPLATATPAGAIPPVMPPPPIVPTGSVALGGEAPAVALPPAPSVSASPSVRPSARPKQPVPKIVPTRPLPHLAGDVAEPELPQIAPVAPSATPPSLGGKIKPPSRPK